MVRYYSNIVGKYGSPVQKALQNWEDCLSLPFALHTTGMDREYSRVIGIYDRLSRYDADEGGLTYIGSMYGNTEQMAEAITT